MNSSSNKWGWVVWVLGACLVGGFLYFTFNNTGGNLLSNPTESPAVQQEVIPTGTTTSETSETSETNETTDSGHEHQDQTNQHSHQ